MLRQLQGLPEVAAGQQVPRARLQNPRCDLAVPRLLGELGGGTKVGVGGVGLPQVDVQGARNSARRGVDGARRRNATLGRSSARSLLAIRVGGPARWNWSRHSRGYAAG